MLLRPAPDDRCIGPRLPDRLDGVVPRAGRHDDLDARDVGAHRPQRAVEDPFGHRADSQGHLLPAREPCGSHVLAGPVDLGQYHPRPLRQDATRGVSSAPRGVRSKSVTRRSRSNARICWESDGVATCNRRAAEENRRSSATVRKYLSWRRSTVTRYRRTGTARSRR